MREFPSIDQEIEDAAYRTLFFVDSKFEGRPCRVAAANYLAFLSMRGSDISVEVEKLKSVLAQHAKEDLEHDIGRLLAARNWRVHNIACVALASGFVTDKSITSLWECIKSGSWVSPQLVATAAYVDPRFKDKALNAIARSETYYKSIVPLAEILRQDFGVILSPQTKEYSNVEEARSIDKDNSGAIASGWLNNLRQAFGLTFRSTWQSTSAS